MASGEFKNALRGTDEIQITVTGRKAGPEISNPLWFVEDDDKLYLLPVRGSDSDWYKNARKTPTIRLVAAGREYSGQAAPITAPARVQGVVEKFRAKYGAGEVKRYYSKLDVALEVPLT